MQTATRRRLFRSIGWAVISWVVLALLKGLLPYNATFERLFAMLTFPAALISRFLLPHGLDRAASAPLWVALLMLVNLGIYSLLIYVVLLIIERR